MSTNSQCSQCGCHCVTPRDCGNCGCGTTPSICPVNASPIPFCLYKSDDLVTTHYVPLTTRTEYDFGAGTNMLCSAWPWVTDTNEDVSTRRVIVNIPPMAPMLFTWNENECCFVGPNGWTLCYGSWTLTSPEGDVWQFTGFEPGEPKGRFMRFTSRDGTSYEAYDPDYVNDFTNSNAYPYTDSGRIKGIMFSEERDGETAYKFLDFTYATDSDGKERVQTAVVRRKASPIEDVERAQFNYRTVTVPIASGDGEKTLYSLKSITRQIYENSAWTTVGQTFTKHYGASETNGYPNSPKYEFDEEAYERLMADPTVTDADTASDAKLAEYATTYFEYDSEGNVTKRKSADGAETIYAYEEGTGSETNRNAFVRKVTETRGGCAVTTTYKNFHGQTILSESKELGDSVGTLNYYQYNSDGNVTLHATPSSLSGYSVNGYTIVPTYKSSAGQYNVGLINVYTYYTDTTTDTGGSAVEGYKEYDKIKQGRDGTEIKIRKYEYTERSASVRLPSDDSGSSSSSSSSGPGEMIDVTVYPIAKEIAYPNEDGTSPIETSYAYTWYTDSIQMLQRTTTLPAVSTAQNGSGTSATRVERFDEQGRLVWTKDERGYISQKEYDLASGNVTQSIEDVDDTQVTVPTGWSTPADGGKHLVTDFEYDNFDRLVQTLGPEHDVEGTTVRTASWTVHKTADRETRSAQGYAVSDGQGGYNYTLVNPVQIEKSNATGTRSETISVVRSSTNGKLVASDTFAQSSYTRWSVSLSNSAGQLTATRTYHEIPTSGDGSLGTNYDETTVGYDALGRQNKSVTPGGTISRTVFDAHGHAVADYVGTDDSDATDADPTGCGGNPHNVAIVGSSSSSSSSCSCSGSNNMVLVAEREYCDGGSGCSCGGGGGTGHLVSETRHVNALTSHMTEFEYDWRGRQLQIFPPADDEGRTVYTKTTYDNLDRATKQERYLEIVGSSDRLLARSETFHDDRGRVYQTKQHAVDVSDGSVGNALVSDSWYDAAGNAIKQLSAGSQAFTKTVYDSLGRAIKQYVGHDTDETAYANASSVSDDTIVEQVETTYDDAGNVLQTTTRQRYHNATGTGELTTPSGSQPKARVTYQATYHDEIGRQVAVADYGTYGGATFSRASVVPNRTDTILVSSTEYNDAGQAYKTVDPAGREDRQVFDNARRVVKTIQNYVDGVVSAAASDEDVTVEMTYNADGNLKTLTAKNPTTGDQTTTYVYGTTLSDSEIATSTLKRAEIYPDSDDTAALGNGTDGVYDRIELEYDRQQRVTEVKDQQGTVHAFNFDSLGRQTQDRVTTLGSGVDDTVRRIATTYDILGRREMITSYDNPTVGSGSVVNQVQNVYNDFGQLVTEYQDHGGVVNTSTSLKVGYSYADGSSGTIRMTKMTYPDGRELNHDYGSSGSTDDALSRVASLIDNDGSTHLVDYSYLGRNTFVKTDYAEPDLRYDLAMGAGDDPYDGFDRFGRIVDSRWYDYGSSADADRILYGYDRAENRTYREQTCDPNSHHDEVYGHDGIDRLTDFDQGTINANKDAMSTLKFAQQWTLDPTGNWSGFKEDSDGDSSWDLDQSRTSNPVNEITNITETSGPSWATPIYNRAGNMTTIPKPADPTSSFTATYDAWNRLVKLEEDGNTLAECLYDGAKRRVIQRIYVSGVLDETRHFYHSARWQVVEERLESSGTIPSDPDRQFVWGRRYIDDFVLRDRDTDSDGTLDERLYGLQDANWNVASLADTGGIVQERYGYSAYGVPHAMTATFTTRASISQGTEVLYAGYRHDAESGLCYVRNRVYHANVGCWLQRDPLGYSDGESQYIYGTGRPVSVSDPSGTLTIQTIRSGLDRAKCGSTAFVQWDFSLDTNVVPDRKTKGAPCNGVLVQRVEALCGLEDCSGDCCRHSGKYQVIIYWEAWEVKKGKRKSSRRKVGGYSDAATFQIPKNTCGNYFQSGVVKFYCIDGTDDPTGNNVGTGNLQGWYRGKTYGQGRCATGAGILLSTDKEPTFWKHPAVDGPASRFLGVSFDCCKKLPPSGWPTIFIPPSLGVLAYASP